MYQITVKTLEGLEDVLAREIIELGGSEVVTGNRAVYFQGDTAMIYRANYRLRTAIRIFKQIESFSFSSVDEFYLKCLKIKWEQFMGLKDTFMVQSTVLNSDFFKNSMYASLKLKDAIADHFRQKKGIRPNVDTAEPDVIFHVHVSGKICTVSVDSSGESLHKRGYRQVQGTAPLNEVLAAGMILLSGWRGGSDFLDPMCGSGTLPIEAALIARNIPPGKFRKTFAFMNWIDFDKELFESVKAETEPAEFAFLIHASDIHGTNVAAARSNARNARIFNHIRFSTSDFGKLDLQIENGVIIMNPPYGERMKETDLPALYRMIGERLKHQYAGNVAWILSSSRELLQEVGLKASGKARLFNGALECSFQKYDLFEGKRKMLILKNKL